MKKKNITVTTALLITAIMAITACDNSSHTSAQTSSNATGEGELIVSYIDVGQGDSALIQANGATMLIDAGEASEGDEVVDYLKEQNVGKLDYIIATHPHADHIGGLEEVIDNFPVTTILMPLAVSTSATFEDLIVKIDEEGIPVENPEVGSTFTLGEPPATVTILGPNSQEYDELNDYSISIRIDYGSRSFLFTGDAETLAEEEMLENGGNLDADVFKAGHHGSDTSNTPDFIDAISPKMVVISCGEDNSYGHPVQSTLDVFDDAEAQIFRTDIDGTVVMTTDGVDISAISEASSGTVNLEGDNVENSIDSNSSGDEAPTAGAPTAGASTTGAPTTGALTETTSTTDVANTPAPTASPLAPETNSPDENVDANGNGMIKGNINSDNEKIYHIPGGASYDNTIAEEYFETEEQAQAAGYRKAKR